MQSPTRLDGMVCMVRRLRVQVLIAALVLLPAALVAQEARDFGAASARVTRAPNGGVLTPPSNAARPAIVTAFLQARHDARTIQSLVLQNEHPAPTGVTHLTFGQRVANLDVYGTYVRAAMTGRGELVSVVENLAPVPVVLPPTPLTARMALNAVLAEHYAGTGPDLPQVRESGPTVVFGRDERFLEDPTATMVAVPLENGAMQRGYLVVTWGRDNMLRHTVVGAGGRILVDELRTNNDTYKIFRDHPGVSVQEVVSGPGSGNLWSPIGWVTNNTTIGNNVDAYLDRDNNNAPDTGGRPVSSTQNFEYTVNLAQAPTNTTNQMAAVTNLFYWNNVIHDKLYRHGFTESAGNFQTNNFGNGGFGNDPVKAEAQDGGGTNNANFATPSDGSSPRMQMYLWTYSSPHRDGDLDSDIIWHEYGHGLTWRMIGAMSGPFAGAIGEGMSDTLAIYMNDNDVVGEYSYNNPKGIRRYPYTDYPLTYANFTGSSVHSDGEIYAATMWRLRELWKAAGLSEDSLFDVIVDGMNYTASRPKFETMRDGLLAAAPTLAEDCLIWEAFAQFGIGEGARGTETCRIFTCSVSVTASFTVPSSCLGPPPNAAPVVTISSPANNSSFEYGTSVAFAGSAQDDNDGNLSASLSWTSSRDGWIGTGAMFATTTLSVGPHTVTASVADFAGLTGTASVTFTVNAVATEPPSITLSATGYKVKGVQHADLGWSGAAGGTVDIFRNGARITTTDNDGAHTDVIGAKGGGSYTYKVCEAGTSVCSPERAVTF
jgi:extracellular elastinolytic metalloproteinase